MSHENGLHEANKQLLETGLFANLGEGGGLYGFVPVQMEGVLASGEKVFLKARGLRVSFQIDDGKTVFFFVHTFVGVKFGYAGWLSGEKCRQFILRCITGYQTGSFPEVESVDTEDHVVFFRSRERVTDEQ